MEVPFIIKTPRLELIAGNLEMARAELSNIRQLASLLNAAFTMGWPPPENDEQTMEWFFRKIYDHPEARGWLMWYFVSVQDNKRTVIGCGGFTGPPDENGDVECGYSILEQAHNKGYATEALRGLLNWAFAGKSVKRVIAKTLQLNLASIKVLEKNLFSFVGEDLTEGLVIYERRKTPGKNSTLML